MSETTPPSGPTGRGLPPPRSPPDAASAPKEAEEASGASPFAAYAPDSSSMNAHAQLARSRSVGIAAIVAGLLFTVGGALAVIAMTFVGVYLFSDELTVAVGDDAREHVIDTGRGKAIRRVDLPPAPRGRRGGSSGAAPAPTGPGPGPVTLIVPTQMVFLSIEVDCPSGFQRRGRFVADPGGETMRATVYNVPPDENCRVTFQGSEPARTYASGHQTKQCTFNPTTCYVR